MGGRRLFVIATLSIATAQGCGSSPASHADGATGADAPADRVDAAVPVFSCSELPCLAAAASVTARCKPSNINSCTNQTTVSGTTSTMNRCFTDGVTIQMVQSNATTSNPNGQAIMSVKNGGALCYSLEIDYTDATRSAGNLVYKDANGTPMVTLFADDTTFTATCPGGTAVSIPSSGLCDEAFRGLGGILPFTSCFNVTEGVCAF
jgi:hypothetical protein